MSDPKDQESIVEDGRVATILSPKSLGTTPPVLANSVNVSTAWSSEVVTLEFFYASTDLRLRVWRGEQTENVEKNIDGDWVMRLEPIARVGLPATVALELVRDILSATSSSVSELRAESKATAEELSRLLRDGVLPDLGTK